ncbi:MAG: hypothetical protein CFH19_01282 [Alphaproteobacteria bacterium MarineAlpha5_Bin9]|nr:MAG: hypothetical protein CFH19_01282 [Alphaproteobacteria bacterium MarineAlpha5_Bin9]|tara:strand:+ start:2451 stop:2756 length:306 start_codon:yes stop_codon:yes gene_type:complete
MTFKIYKPSKSAMQSGRSSSKKWIAEYISNISTSKDKLMGWTSSNDTNKQIKLFFENKENAINWAKNNNVQFIVYEPDERKITPKSYASNFDYKKKEPWTH